MIEMDLSMEHKEFVVSLLKFRVKEQTVALMLMLLTTPEAIDDLIDYFLSKEEEVVKEYPQDPNFVNSLILEYLMNSIKGSGIGIPKDEEL